MVSIISCFANTDSSTRVHRSSFVVALLISWSTTLIAAREPREPGDGSPGPPCTNIDVAIPDIQLEIIGAPLVGCTVDIASGGTRVFIAEGLCNSDVVAQLPPSAPTSWELVSFPAGPTPSLSTLSSLATLSLPRAGKYGVRFTVCPEGGCTFEMSGLNGTYPLSTDSLELTIVAVDAIPQPVEHEPVVAGTGLLDTRPTAFPDAICRCQAGGGIIDPQWVTVREWRGAADYDLVEGWVAKSWISASDHPLNHESHDVNFNVRVDPRHRYVLSTDPEFTDPSLLGCEWEREVYPDRMRPNPGDRVSVFGYWINDCGHWPFYTELHPAVGVAVHRPRAVMIPSQRTFAWQLPNGLVTSNAGTNVVVPGIVTDIWFNRESGDLTHDCNFLGVHTPAECNPACPFPPTENDAVCTPFFGGDCISAPAPVDRVFEFRIYLPLGPDAVARRDGAFDPAPAPLHVEISNPHGSSGPDPVVTEVTEGDVTYLNVEIDLRGFAGFTYSRRIVSAWVYAAPDNWGVERSRVLLHGIDVHDDLDSWLSFPSEDGDFQIWLQIKNSDQEWTRILDGVDNAHGLVSFSPPWQTGGRDPILWRPLGDIDSARRLGSEVYHYPGEGIWFGVCGREDDVFDGDDPGRVSFQAAGPGRYSVPSSKGPAYSIDVEIVDGEPLPNATLSTAASQLLASYSRTCSNRPMRPPVPPRIFDPRETGSCLVTGVSRRPPLEIESGLVRGDGGSALSAAGDVNGDGYSDFIVGTRDFGAPQTPGTGRARVYYGFAGDLATPAFDVVGTVRGMHLGASVASGDFNGDGFSDVAIGAPGYSGRAVGEGAVFVFHGSESGLPASAALGGADGTLVGGATDAEFGFAIGGSGDVDGDGFDDLVVGSPGFGTQNGRVSLFRGSPQGLEARTPAWTADPDVVGGSGQRFGHAVAIVRDVDDDGFDEILAGAPLFTRIRPRVGASFLWRGARSLPSTIPAWQVEGSESGAELGTAVEGAGDVDGDGRGDFLVGVPGFARDDAQLDLGEVLLFRGSSGALSTSDAFRAVGTTSGGRLGSAVAGLGDIDDDGFADFAAGAPGDSTGGENAGRVLVWRGQEGPIPATLAWDHLGRSGDALGGGIGDAGDVDVDGFADFLVGRTGVAGSNRAELLYGCGPRAVRPFETRFFRSVGSEEFALLNLFEGDLAERLAESYQDTPEKLERGLAALRAEFDSIQGSDREVDAILELSVLRQYFSPDLWLDHFGDVRTEVRGALFLNCGGSEVTVDARGRRWKPDGPFVSSFRSRVESGQGQQIDTSRMTDPVIPNDVLLSSRSSPTAIVWEIPAPTAAYRVVLYFAEICESCVAPALGGTGCDGCRRLFDIDVEGTVLNGYNPADEALLPAGDGRGVTFTATQVEFATVMVHDGSLTIRLSDLGAGNPPEDPAIQAIAITADGVGVPSRRQRPGDCNQDGRLDLSDGICILGHLFQGSPARLPCGDGTTSAPGNRALLDSNADARIDLTDGIYVFTFLFSGGPPPELGQECVGVEECPDACKG